jgi:2-polyprenyl-3-methyl-5-hydroxy-6-metoxy-1,4-benzoquinol methylase
MTDTAGAEMRPEQRQAAAQRRHFNALVHADSVADDLNLGAILRPGPARRREYAAFFGFAQIPPQSSVLEIGCGTGNYTIPLLLQGHRVTALDIADGAVALLRQRAEALGVTNRLRLIAGPIEALSVGAATPPQTDTHFDCVICVDTLHHVPDLAGVVKAMAALVRPGGVWVCLEPNGRFPLWPYYGLINPAFDWEHERGTLACTERSLRAAAEGAGLAGARVRYWQYVPGVLTDAWPVLRYVNDVAARIPLARDRAAFVFVRATRPRPPLAMPARA